MGYQPHPYRRNGNNMGVIAAKTTKTKTKSKTTLKVAYNPKYTIAEYGFDTTRKAKWIADELENEAVPNTELLDPAAFINRSKELISEIHSQDYVQALITGSPSILATSQGFSWDKGIWEMALNSTAGVIAATELALQEGAAGSLSSGLHHARRDSGAGFCTVNGLAVAATHAKTLVDGRIIILDFDAHCGGGTHSLIKDDRQILHLDLSTNGFDSYEPVGENCLEIGNYSDDSYLEEVDEMLNRIPLDTGLLIYNAGMDPAPMISGEALQIREQRVATWAAERQIPAVFVLAGGYTWSMSQEELVELHLNTIEAFTQSLLVSNR